MIKITLKYLSIINLPRYYYYFGGWIDLLGESESEGPVHLNVDVECMHLSAKRQCYLISIISIILTGLK